MNVVVEDGGIAWAEVGDGKLIVKRHHVDWENRTVYQWEVWVGAYIIERGEDLHTGVGIDRGPVAMLGTLCSFLEAAAESMRSTPPGENADLFNERTCEWAYVNDLGLTLIRLDIEEGVQP